MARDKYKRKPYVYKAWPKMFFHPVTAAYIVCQDESEVPEGWLNNINDCERKLDPTEEPTRHGGSRVIDGAKETKSAKKTAANKKAKAKKPEPEEVVEDEDPVTLESLEITRKTAMEMLDEEKVPYKKNASNDALAALVAGLLEE